MTEQTRLRNLAIAKDYVEHHISYADLSTKYHLDPAIIKYSVALYKRHGESIFLNPRTNPYTREEKLKIIQRVNAGESMRSVGIELGVLEPKTIRNWMRIYKTYGEDHFKDDQTINAEVPVYNYNTLKDEKFVLSRKQMMKMQLEIEISKKVRALIREKSRKKKR